MSCATAGAVLLGVLASSCTTVVFSENNATERATAVERAELKRAAAELARTKWPQPQAASWRTRLTGVVDNGAWVSTGDAANAYVASLGGAPDRSKAVVADAERHLQAAASLARAAGAAAEAIRPAMSDVSIVEDAIGDLTQIRDIYLASLKALAHDGETVDPAEMRQLKHAFNEAIEQIGAAADVLADRVADDRTETFAEPAVRRNLSGSL